MHKCSAPRSRLWTPRSLWRSLSAWLQITRERKACSSMPSTGTTNRKLALQSKIPCGVCAAVQTKSMNKTSRSEMAAASSVTKLDKATKYKHERGRLGIAKVTPQRPGADSTKISPTKECVCAKRTGVAASVDCDVSPPGRSCRSDSHMEAPVLFAHAVATVAKKTSSFSSPAPGLTNGVNGDCPLVVIIVQVGHAVLGRAVRNNEEHALRLQHTAGTATATQQSESAHTRTHSTVQPHNTNTHTVTSLSTSLQRLLWSLRRTGWSPWCPCR